MGRPGRDQLNEHASESAFIQRFVLSGPDTPTEPTLLSETHAGAFRRFVFWKLFQPDMLIAERGAPMLDRLLRDQVVREKTIEKDFYREYHDYREFVYRSLVESNPNFTGARGQLVRITQRFLDRCIFILFCDDSRLEFLEFLSRTLLGLRYHLMLSHLWSSS